MRLSNFGYKDINTLRNTHKDIPSRLIFAKVTQRSISTSVKEPEPGQKNFGPGSGAGYVNS
jgi:hypothetical protein